MATSPEAVWTAKTATAWTSDGEFATLKFGVPILAKNAGKPEDVRQKNAEKEFEREVYPTLDNNELWTIQDYLWEGPLEPDRTEYALTVFLKLKESVVPPTDNRVGSPNPPPPSA